MSHSIEDKKPLLSYNTFVEELAAFDRWEEFLEQELDEEDLPELIAKMRGVVSFALKEYDPSKPVVAGQSKVGGAPHMPATFSWPEYNNQPLHFLAQFNLADIKTDTEQALPQSGMLYFFIATSENMDWDDSSRHEFAVLYYDGPLNESQFISLPAFIEEQGVLEEQLIFFSNRVDIECDQETLQYYDGLEDVMHNIFSEYNVEVTSEAPGISETGKESFIQGKLLGSADALQGPVEDDWMEDDFEAAMEDDFGEYEEKSYRLLFQCNGDDVGWGGDMMIYFGIDKEDLQAKDFSKIRLVLQGT